MKVLLIALMSAVTLFGGGNVVAAQDSAYPPRLIVVSVSDSSVEAGAPYSVSVSGCDVGRVVEFTLEGVLVRAQCVRPDTEQSALVLTSVPGRADAELTAPNSAGDYVGNARITTDDGSLDLDFDLEVVEAAPAFAPTSATGTSAGSDSAFSSVLWMLLTFILGLGLASGFWVVAQRRE